MSNSHSPEGDAVAQAFGHLEDARLWLSTEVRHQSVPERGDDGTNDLMVSELIRVNELQSWFVRRHLGAPR